MTMLHCPRLALALVLAAAACGPKTDDPAEADTDGEGSDTGGTAATTLGPATMSASGMMTAGDTGVVDDGVDDGGDETTGGVDDDAGPADSSGGFIEMPDMGGTSPLPNGQPCDGDGQCESEHCYSIPSVGGVCSECGSDADCEMGTCAIDFQSLYAVCTEGQQGVMCDSDEGCMGDLVCAEILDTGGFFPATFCSACRPDDVPCDDGEICTPVYDLANFQGYLDCLPIGSVMDGGGCPVSGGVGDGTACASGFCGLANVFMVVDVGVCGQCLVDADCPEEGQTCVPPSADMSGLTPAVCA